MRVFSSAVYENGPHSHTAESHLAIHKDGDYGHALSQHARHARWAHVLPALTMQCIYCSGAHQGDLNVALFLAILRTIQGANAFVEDITR